MARSIRIETPRGAVYHDKNGKVVLEWNTSKFSGGGGGGGGGGDSWQSRFNNAQEFVDSEVLRLSQPYTPHLTGMLIKSSELGTEVGSGTVKWIAPYSRYQYYLERKNPSAEPLRGPYWFERMKQVHKAEILRGARSRAGGEK